MNSCRILLLGPHLAWNLGGPSLISGIIRALDEQIEGCEFVLANSFDEELECPEAEQYGIPFVSVRAAAESPNRVLASATLARMTRKPLLGPAGVRDFIRLMQSVDLVIGAEGIRYADSLGNNGFWHRFYDGYLFGVAKALNKPTIQYTADFGPLEARWNRCFAKFWLGRAADAVICRNKTSHDWLARIGISGEKLFVAPDSGFLMEPHACEESARIGRDASGVRTVAIGISHQVRRRFSQPDEYDRLVSDLVRHVLQRQDCRALIVPNELHHRAEVDDRAIAQTITNQVADPRVSMLDTSELTGPQTKAVLGECAAIVSSRYHSLVAALSMGVPCLALGWHHKYSALFSLFGMEHWVLDYRTAGIEVLSEAYDRLWSEQDELRRTIHDHLPSVESGVREAAAAVSRRVAAISPHRVKLRDVRTTDAWGDENPGG